MPPPHTHTHTHTGTFNAVDFMSVLKQLSDEYGEEASEGSVNDSTVAAEKS